MFRRHAHRIAGLALALAFALPLPAAAFASWDGYANMLAKAMSSSACGLFDFKGTPQDSLKRIPATPDQIRAIIAGFDKPDDLRAGGIRVGTAKYMFLNVEHGILRGKLGVSAIYAAKSTRIVSICLTGASGPTPALAINAMDKFVDLLKSKEF